MCGVWGAEGSGVMARRQREGRYKLLKAGKKRLPFFFQGLKGTHIELAKRFSRSVTVMKGYSSVGRAAVSKTAGRKFEPYCPCHFPFASAVFAARQMDTGFPVNFAECRFPLVKSGIGVYVGQNRHAVRGAD